MRKIKCSDDQFSDIYQGIKTRYLSATNFPKLIIGSGLSVSLGIPGMGGLADKLNKTFEKTSDEEIKARWEECKPDLKHGLEVALTNVSSDDQELIEKIKEVTSEFILDSEYEHHFALLNQKSGFEKLLKYLSNTVSVNNPLIDIMTPNYDRAIEIICDKIGLTCTLGFVGNIYRTFSKEVLLNPFLYYYKDQTIVRLFKPHGSLNWLFLEHQRFQIDDYEILKSNKSNIEIVAPGGLKYKDGMLNDVFREHREAFNGITSNEKKNFSIFIYGYGFNDEHFNQVFHNTSKDIIVLARTIKSDYLAKAKENNNWTLFYKYIDCEDEKELGRTKDTNFMVYRGEVFEIYEELWDINVFSNIFLA